MQSLRNSDYFIVVGAMNKRQQRSAGGRQMKAFMHSPQQQVQCDL